jgi:hypothetical protein
MRRSRRPLPGHGLPSPRSLPVDPREFSTRLRLEKLTANPLEQILKVVEVEKTEDIRRPYIKQLITKDLKFPLPHRQAPKRNKNIFAATRPNTFY